MCSCVRHIANMNGIIFPSISFPLLDHDLISDISILRKIHDEFTSPHGTLCTHLVARNYVTIYESATLRALHGRVWRN